MAQLAIAKLLERQGADTTDWLVKTEQTATHLIEDYPARSRHRELTEYYATSARYDEAISILREAIADGAGSTLDSTLHAMLLAAEGSTYAVKDIHPQYLVLAMDAARTTQGQKEIIAKVRAANSDPAYSTVGRIYIQFYLCACGAQDEAMEEWQKMLASEKTLLWNEEYPLRFLTGQWDEKRVLDTVVGSELRTSLIHYVIANKYLFSDGNRAKAKEHFQACERCVIVSNFVQWARAVLARMEDPAWPKWLPGGEAALSNGLESSGRRIAASP
jgi:hypothetical protein